ncbi:hypothetical protein FOZ62_028483, partial [Perkinsus olseni]
LVCTWRVSVRYVTVGSRYKNPELPLWVIGSPNHYTLLFSRNLNCVKRNPISVVRDKLTDIFDANCTDAGIATVEQADKMILHDIPDDLIPPGSSRTQMVAVVKESALDGSIVLYDSFQSTFCKALFGEARIAEVDADSRRPSAYTTYLYDGQKPGGPSLREIKVITSNIEERYAAADSNESLQKVIQTRWPNAVVQVLPPQEKVSF